MSETVTIPGACAHIELARDVVPQSEGCAACLALGDTWVHLRLCLICGHVGCCNESPNRHAQAHFNETGHPVMRSFEPGEDWMWCYLDDTVVTGPGSAINKAFSKEVMRKLPLFSDLSENDLDQLYAMTMPVVVPAGEILLKEGAPGDSLYVILDGELEISQRQGDQDVVLAIRGAGDFIGEMALLENAPRSATARTLTETTLLVVSQHAFHTLLACSTPATLAILRAVMARLRASQSALMQQEKMAGLGTLAAGVAHELNNPAAAIQRSAAQLQTALARLERASTELASLGLGAEEVDDLGELREQTRGRGRDLARYDPLVVSEREDELQEWLEDQELDEAWELAPPLVACGWDRASIVPLTERFTGGHLPSVLRWLAYSCSADTLLDEVQRSGRGISEIVKAVKTYSYLDRAPVQDVDVHESLENTLIMLQHKLKSGVTVTREYGDIPHLEAYGSELSQVWTNIVDNAIGAMDGSGELGLRTYLDGDKVVVEISDNGPGIPPDVLPRIFEPFYTTKEPGKGTGLGLHIAYSSIVNKHRGRIDVDSQPGKTVFRVTLPTHLS